MEGIVDEFVNQEHLELCIHGFDNGSQQIVGHRAGNLKAGEPHLNTGGLQETYYDGKLPCPLFFFKDNDLVLPFFVDDDFTKFHLNHFILPLLCVLGYFFFSLSSIYLSSLINWFTS